MSKFLFVIFGFIVLPKIVATYIPYSQVKPINVGRTLQENGTVPSQTDDDTVERTLDRNGAPFNPSPQPSPTVSLDLWFKKRK
jgi:hypothetical protein